MLITEYFAEWLELKKPELRKSTYDAYCNYINRHIIPYFEQHRVNLEKLTPVMVKKYVNDKLQGGRLDGKTGGLNDVSVRKHLNVIKQALNDAVLYGYLSSSPANAVRMRRRTTTLSDKIRYLTADEAKAILNVLEQYPVIHLAVMLSLFYGLRKSEVLGLRWSAIDFDRDVLCINHTVVKGSTIEAGDQTKTEGSKAKYQLLPNVKTFLQAQKARTEQIHSEYVFTNEDGSVMRPDSLTRTFQRCLKRHGFEKMRFHDLRHSTATILFDRGWSVEDVRQWLRHSDIETTFNIYNHYQEYRKVLMAEDISRIFA